MKKSTPTIVIFLISISLLISCGSVGSISSTERDGLSFETAVIAKSVSFEYEWLRKNYPGSQPQMQMLSKQKNKPYDIITILTKSGETKDIYFDISRFYGKGF